MKKALFTFSMSFVMLLSLNVSGQELINSENPIENAKGLHNNIAQEYINNYSNNISINIKRSNVNQVKFSFVTFERFKGKLMDIRSLDIPEKRTRLEQNNYILNHVNKFYDTDIDYDKDLKKLNSSDKIFEWLVNNSNFNHTDVDILTNFSANLTTKNFDESILLLEKDLSNEKVDKNKLEKYESIVNGIKLIEYQNKGFFTVESTQKSWGCAWAVAKLALATAGLVAGCNPPAAGASVGTSCYLAATTFIAASASVGMACGD